MGIGIRYQNNLLKYLLFCWWIESSDCVIIINQVSILFYFCTGGIVLSGLCSNTFRWFVVGLYSTPQKQSTMPASLPTSADKPVPASSPTLALRRSTQISKNGISEITAMIDASWVTCWAPVIHMQKRVVPTICDVNHNDPDPERLMKMTHAPRVVVT
jgi:hypothetical protein